MSADKKIERLERTVISLAAMLADQIGHHNVLQIVKELTED
jgi:hypothetical protein